MKKEHRGLITLLSMFSSPESRMASKAIRVADALRQVEPKKKKAKAKDFKFKGF